MDGIKLRPATSFLLRPALRSHRGRYTPAGAGRPATRRMLATSMVQGKLAEREGGAQSSPASSPGQPAPAASPQPHGSAGASHDEIERLKELGQLHDQGILTDEEFATQKAQILGG